MKQESAQPTKQIFTIPNLLSFFRLCLIPIIVWLYVGLENLLWTVILLLISGLTDIVDGIIARRFNMVSDLGKALDPFADKLTQIGLLFCLVTRFPMLLIPLCCLALKELLAATLNMITIKHTGSVMSAKWHGKATTVAVYCMILIHLLWFDIPALVSNIILGVATGIMLLSAILYTIDDLRALSKIESHTK